MIPSTLRITLIFAVICYFIIILYFLKNIRNTTGLRRDDFLKENKPEK